MITEATISIVCVFIILMTACGYYALPSGEKKGRVVFMLLLLYSLIHVVGDGALRATLGTARAWSWADMTEGRQFYAILFLVGLAGVLQLVFDMVWIKTHEKVSTGVIVMQNTPLLIITVVIIFINKPEFSTIIKYFPLLYALICFLLAIWYFEKLNSGIRCGLIAATVGSVLVFICNSLLHITDIPVALPVVLILIAFSFDGRGVKFAEDELDEELIPTTEKRERIVQSFSTEENTEDDKPATETEILVSELEQMMSEQKDRKDGGRLEVEEAAGRRQTGAPAPDMPDEDSIVAAGMQAVQPKEQPVSTQTASLDTIPIMEFLEAATVLTAESDSEAEDAMQRLSQVDETVTDVLHSRPLILEKDLNDFYHRMKKAVAEKDHDTCLEIMSEMSEYRFSGIHVTRYERIRHAVMDADWKTVEKELKDF